MNSPELVYQTPHSSPSVSFCPLATFKLAYVSNLEFKSSLETKTSISSYLSTLTNLMLLLPPFHPNCSRKKSTSASCPISPQFWHHHNLTLFSTVAASDAPTTQAATHSNLPACRYIRSSHLAPRLGTSTTFKLHMILHAFYCSHDSPVSPNQLDLTSILGLTRVQLLLLKHFGYVPRTTTRSLDASCYRHLLSVVTALCVEYVMLYHHLALMNTVAGSKV